MIRKYQTAWLFGGVLFFVCVDLATKMFAVRYVDIVCNDGVAFGVAVPRFVIIAVSTGILFFLFRWYLQLQYDQFLTVRWAAFLFLFSGGVGNLYDRVVFGCVRDFIPFFGLWTFNFADLFITIGVLLLALYYIKMDKL